MPAAPSSLENKTLNHHSSVNDRIGEAYLMQSFSRDASNMKMNDRTARNTALRKMRASWFIHIEKNAMPFKQKMRAPAVAT